MSGTPAQTGVPDGDGRASVVVNRRVRTVLKPRVTGDPNHHRIKFILGVSPTGVVTEYSWPNTFEYEVRRLDYSTAAGHKLVTINSATRPHVVPMVTDQTSIAGVNSELSVTTGIEGVSWRLVNAVHKQQFTGSSLNNGGSVKITPMTIAMRSTSIRSTNSGNKAAYAFTQLPLDPALLPGSYVGAARDPVSVVQVPRSTEYTELTPAYAIANGAGISPFGPSPVETLWWAPHPDLRFYMVEYEGLAEDASVTIDSSVCQQVIRQAFNTTELALAKPSESAPPNLFQEVLGKLSCLAINHGLDIAKHVYDALR